MHCPQCGQQQVSDEVRFCSRCGLPLAAVARLLDDGGHLAGFEEGEGRRLSTRQRGTRKGLIIMAGGFVFFILAALLTAMDDDFFVLLLVAALALVVGFMRILYAMLLEDSAPRAADKGAAKQKTPPALEGAPSRGRGAPLPPARGFSAADLTRGRAETAEMVAPQSVTENTTRLLEEDERR